MNINIFLDVEWQYPSTKLHGVTPLMTVIFTNTAATTSYVTSPDTVNSGIRFVDTSQKIKKSSTRHTPAPVQNANLSIINVSPQFSSGSSKHRNYALILSAVPIHVPVPNLYPATSCYAHLPASFNGTSAVRKFSEKLDAISKFYKSE